MQLAEQLQTYIDDHADTQFNWLTANCCHFAAGWVELVTGARPMEGIKPTQSRVETRRRIAELGGSLAVAVTQQLGREPVPPLFAQLGDIVLIDLPDVGVLLGICTGRHVVCVAESGLVRLPVESGVAAWRLKGAA